MTIYDYIKRGINPSNMVFKIWVPNDKKRLSYPITKQNIQYYINYLKNNGHIKRIGYGTWEVKKEVKKTSLGMRDEKPVTNLHALNIKIPILKGKITSNDWEIKHELNNWIPKYKNLEILGGLTLKNNNDKSISIFAKTRDIERLEEVDNLAFKIRAYVYDFFKRKGVILDVFNAQTKNLNLATEDKDAQCMLRKGEKFELDLKKIAERIFERDKIKAKAWIDGTPFDFSAETNDKEWKREYLNMPFRIRDSIRILELMVYDLNYVAENYKSHVGMVEEGHKIFKKINKKLSQTDLRKWF